MKRYGMTRNDAEIYQCVMWNMQEAFKQLVKLSDELGFGYDKGELKYQCPYIYQYTAGFKYAYDAHYAALYPKGYKKRLASDIRSTPFPEASNDKYKCRNDPEFKTFTSGAYTNCFVCMFEQKLTERVTHNKKERETQHHLLHALKVAKKSYKVYDECERTMKCPINKYGKKH